MHQTATVYDKLAELIQNESDKKTINSKKIIKTLNNTQNADIDMKKARSRMATHGKVLFPRNHGFDACFL